MSGGRPIRFSAIVIGGWIGARVALMWPVDQIIPALTKALVPSAAAAAIASGPALAPAPTPARISVAFHLPMMPVATSTGIPAPEDQERLHRRRILGLAGLIGYGAVTPLLPGAAIVPPRSAAPVATPLTAAPRRVSGSAWLIARPGGGTDAGLVPQLGGSQAGSRLTWAVADARRLAVSARLSGALNGQDRDLGVGLDWQPGRAPVHFVVERRVALSRAGSGGTVAGVIAGIDPVKLGGGFRLEGYGQGGAIARGGGVEGFADGSLRAATPVLGQGAMTLDLGLGGWGGIQRGARRVDIGPSASLSLPFADRRLRVAVEWRERIAGNAEPGSGPALAIGTNF